MATTTIDEETIKSRQQATWSSGDYSVIGTTLQITGEMLCESVDVGAGERVLDVAAGNGNAALAAARRGASVTATDYVPELLGRARARAAAEGLKLDVREGDAESLPFAGATFDVVLSTFGVMFTPNQERAAVGASASVPARRTDRSCELDARRIRRRDVHDRGPIPSPAGRWAFPARMGKRRTGSGAVREPSASAHDATPGVRVPVSLARALAGRVPQLLRADPQGVRIARPGRTRRVRA